MRSIQTLFLRDRVTRLVINKPFKAIDWVLNSKGTPTRKWDGIAILVDKGSVYHRVEWHFGSPIPNGFIKCQDINPKYPNASIPGWVLVNPEFRKNPRTSDEKNLSKAWELYLRDIRQELTLKAAYGKAEVINPYAPVKKEIELSLPDGTYELCGPNIRGNNEDLIHPKLYRHDAHTLRNVPRTFEGLRKYLETFEGEGIVWHYKLGEVVHMAKLKRHDFGFFGRPAKNVVKEIQPAKEEINVVANSASGV